MDVGVGRVQDIMVETSYLGYLKRQPAVKMTDKPREIAENGRASTFNDTSSRGKRTSLKMKRSSTWTRPTVSSTTGMT